MAQLENLLRPLLTSEAAKQRAYPNLAIRSCDPIGTSQALPRPVAGQLEILGGKKLLGAKYLFHGGGVGVETTHKCFKAAVVFDLLREPNFFKRALLRACSILLLLAAALVSPRIHLHNNQTMTRGVARLLLLGAV